MTRTMKTFRAALPELSRRPAALPLLLVLFLLPRYPACAQQDADDPAFRELVGRLENGETEEVRRELPGLISKYQNHPGVLYIQARIASDGIEAAKLYQGILDNYPRSEWADDALFHLQQYYYAMGLYKTAELKMQQLRKEYPDSEYLAAGKTPPPVIDTGSVPSGPTRPVVHGDSVQPADADRPGVTGKTELPGADTTGSGVAERPAVVPPAAVPERTYVLQTGAFSTADNAFAQKSFFEQRGYPVEVANKVRGGRSLYLVWVGNYSTPEQAREALREIRTRYDITPIVVER